VADYPFTTLQPHLGVVRIGTDQSFVIADIPGLIEGAADGAGLGIQFLKHVSRTRLLLHLVDIAPLDEQTSPFEQVRVIEAELEQFDDELLTRPRWLVMNKADLLPPEESEKLAKALVKKLKWKQPWFLVSAIAREGTWPVCLKIQDFFDRLKAEAAEESRSEDA
jgi:GTP-binding protein